MPIGRRELLTATVLGIVLAPVRALAAVVAGRLPWKSDAGSPPEAVRDGPWQFFTTNEAAAIEAVVDRLIPADPHTPGGKDAGCAVYMDRALAGAYGRADGLYRAGPFVRGAAQQGDQSELTPAARCREGLLALDRYCRSTYPDRPFARLGVQEQDEVLGRLEAGTTALGAADAGAFFDLLLKLTQEGFFADPIYGGNRDMCAWRMIGFPGARYDYSDWVERHNERYPGPPVSIGGRREWMQP